MNMKQQLQQYAKSMGKLAALKKQLSDETQVAAKLLSKLGDAADRQLSKSKSSYEDDFWDSFVGELSDLDRDSRGSTPYVEQQKVAAALASGFDSSLKKALKEADAEKKALAKQAAEDKKAMALAKQQEAKAKQQAAKQAKLDAEAKKKADAKAKAEAKEQAALQKAAEKAAAKEAAKGSKSKTQKALDLAKKATSDEKFDAVPPPRKLPKETDTVKKAAKAPKSKPSEAAAVQTSDVETKTETKEVAVTTTTLVLPPPEGDVQTNPLDGAAAVVGQA